MNFHLGKDVVETFFEFVSNKEEHMVGEILDLAKNSKQKKRCGEFMGVTLYLESTSSMLNCYQGKGYYCNSKTLWDANCKVHVERVDWYRTHT